MRPLALEEIEEEGRGSLSRRHHDLSRPSDREGAVRCWVRAFLTRWSTRRHLLDVETIELDSRALAERDPRTAAEEVFVAWLGDEAARHARAIKADGRILARLEDEAGRDFIREAVEAADRLFPDRRIQVDGGSPMPKGGDR